jgi:group I intron endonuclease
MAYIFLGKGIRYKFQLSKFSKNVVKKCNVIYGLSFPNGKWYVGQSESFWENRFNVYKNNTCKTQIKLTRALKKYKWEDISLMIFDYNFDIKDIDDKEIFYISQLNSYKNGYNCSKGGKVLRGENNPMYGKKGELSPIFGLKRTIETRQLQSISHLGIQAGENNPMFGRTGKKHPLFGMIGELSPFYGRKHTEQTKKNQSILVSGEKHPMYGRKHTTKSIEKMSGENNPNSKKVSVYGNIYSSCGEASRILGPIFNKNYDFIKRWVHLKSYPEIFFV